MVSALGQAGAVVWLSIFVKALAYATTLSAIGAVLVMSSLRELSESGRRALCRTAALSALASAAFTVLRLPVRASFLMGGTWEGALDSMIIGMVADSPLGTSAALRLVGLALIVCVIRRSRAGHLSALFGSLLASTSFALRGHALSDPHMILGALVTIHILCLAFWAGAFAPLIRSARYEPPARTGALAHEFGRLALRAVVSLVLAGGIMLVLLGAATPSALLSPYGQLVAVKFVLFAGVMSLAAYNKLSLTPALLASKPGVGATLRRSIAVEAALLAGILVTTAALTTISSPPDNSRGAKTSFMTPPLSQTRQTLGSA